MLSKLNLFFFLLFATVCGIVIAFVEPSPLLGKMDKLTSKHTELSNQMEKLEETSSETKKVLQEIRVAVDLEKKEIEEQQKMINNLVATSKNTTKTTGDVSDNLLTNMLGDPIGQTFGKNARIKVFSLKEAGYRGVMAKVRLHNPNAIKMVLADDKVYSNGETTSQSARRKGAILAINAGGFNTGKGKLSPLGVTVVDGQVKTFSDNPNLSFVGFDKNGHLTRGRVTSAADVKKKGIMQGASFLPVLLEGGKKKPIPSAWANKREPRTLIGNFENGDLLFIVIDGRNKDWSNGVTLEEAQRKLLEFKVRDAYNLDGGGSSAFYYNGKVMNQPSSGKERPVTTNLIIMP
ncbi:phosphodiester glycosidase family protein [Brevibacillus daliensis]|uniref:phosphodiester glycosidase family protein n=1 Tax=Brevibacillus daliensis TaxID=2892995 RepID=UPI001E5D3815|nr:phosphodiester glycosidase family protein [Brevibacillus daliensis]